MRKYLVFFSLMVVGSLIFAVSPGVAQPTEPYPIGEVSLEASAVAAGVGFSWGDGVLKFRGKEYKFKVTGLNVGAVGLSKIKAVGDVYNLENPADFAGNYAAVEAGLALGKGVAGLVMRNPRGVIMNLRSVQQGVQITLGVQGIGIEMK
ncbi:MAG: hypothetical protein FJ134_02815 [Deltaproteobacteria bacterium]|nr:hypothetical protein [Deltaproteobacteria bacterium]